MAVCGGSGGLHWPEQADGSAVRGLNCSWVGMGQAGLKVASGAPRAHVHQPSCPWTPLEQSPPRAVPPLHHNCPWLMEQSWQVTHMRPTTHPIPRSLPACSPEPQGLRVFRSGKTVPLLPVGEGGSARNLGADARAMATFPAHAHVTTHTGTQEPTDTRRCCCGESLTGLVHHHTGQGLPPQVPLGRCVRAAASCYTHVCMLVSPVEAAVPHRNVTGPGRMGRGPGGGLYLRLPGAPVPSHELLTHPPYGEEGPTASPHE